MYFKICLSLSGVHLFSNFVHPNKPLCRKYGGILIVTRSRFYLFLEHVEGEPPFLPLSSDFDRGIRYQHIVFLQ